MDWGLLLKIYLFVDGGVGKKGWGEGREGRG